jgi:predicted RNA-binding protein with PUA-like domain
MAKPPSPAPQSWLVKSEPESYSWKTFVADGKTAWTGIRSFAARMHLRAMKKGDRVFFYHSNVGKEIVGLAEVAKSGYPDPTADEGDWTAVDLLAGRPLKKPVTLDAMKADPVLKHIELIRQSRLSVLPVKPAEAARILKLGACGTE